MAFDERFLSELRERNDITDVVSEYVNLSKRQGRIRKGLCPFHGEKTPSFAVYEDTQSFYCFGCGVGGDVIMFIRNIENLDYLDAVKKLAQRAGLTLPEEQYDNSLHNKKKRILEINKLAAKFFYTKLLEPENKFALEYYLNRGYTPSTIKHFGLGYAPNDWTQLKQYLNEHGYRNDEIYEADLVKKSEKNSKTNFYDNFRNRMMTPIIDVRGNVVGFGGRVLDDSKPKYVNTADTLVYKKSNEVFALNFAKNANPENFIVCEGYMDVIALHQAGFTNAVACLGTSLTTEQAKLIKRYVPEVILSYDSDEAGQKATQRAISIFSSVGLKVRVLKLSGGKDPDEIIKKYGPERFRMILEGAQNDIEYTIIKIRDKYDVSTSDGKTKFLTEAAQFLATLQNPIEQDTYASKLAEQTGVEKQSIMTFVKSASKKIYKKQFNKKIEDEKKKSLGIYDKINSEKKDNYRASKAEETLLALLLRNPDFWERIKNEVSPDDFQTSFNRRIFKSLIEKIENGEAVDVSAFSEDFLPEETGRISFLFNRGDMVSNTEQECRDCIKVLKEEQLKQVSDVSQMDDDDFAKLFKDLAKK